MANWSNPQLTTTYTDFLDELKNRDIDLALQFNGTTSTNIPSGTVQWDGTANRWKKWTGSAWGELATVYALTSLTTTGNATIAGSLVVSGATSLGNATATSPSVGDDSTKVATTQYVQGQGYARISNPTFTGTPAAPTASVGTNTTQLATTAFVNAEINNDAILKTGGTLTGDLVLASGSPSTAQSAVPRSYIDRLDWKQSVRCASTAAFTVVPTGVTVLRASSNGPLSIDSVSPSVGDRVLLTAQASGWQNGIYQVTDAGSVSTTWVLTRPADADSWDEIAGSAVVSRSGTSNGDRIFLCTSDTGGTLGSTSIDWQVTFSSYLNSLLSTTGPGLVTKSGNTASARSIAVSGSGLSVSNADGAAGNPTISLASASDNTVSTVVFRDGSGGFSAGTINLKMQNSLRLEASGSTNYIGLRAPATVTTSTLLTLPNGAGSSGQVLSTNGTGTLSWATPRKTATYQYSATGTAITDAIDSYATRVVIDIVGLSTTTAVVPTLQLSYGGVYVVTGYTGSVSTASSTSTTNAALSTGFALAAGTWASGNTISGRLVLTKYTSGLDSWICTGQTGRHGTAALYSVAGSLFEGGVTADAIRLYIDGTAQFDAGVVQFTYES
jgi:hypothetical protein